MANEPSAEDEDLTKVFVDLPGHWFTDGESLWAKHLGADLYEIRNVPFAAYGINHHDVVRAVSTTPDLKPEVREVVSQSGHRTLRIIFSTLPKDEQTPYLDSVELLGVDLERANTKLVAVDIPPTADYQAVCDRLHALEKTGVLAYETCEERVPGRFTCPPDKPGPN
jgi:hypothetical protein